jgi:hypothetical protein
MNCDISYFVVAVTTMRTDIIARLSDGSEARSLAFRLAKFDHAEVEGGPAKLMRIEIHCVRPWDLILGSDDYTETKGAYAICGQPAVVFRDGRWDDLHPELSAL